MNKNLLAALITLVIAISDYITKKIIVAKIPLYESVDFLPFLRIVHYTNKGSAFGMFASLGNTFFIAVSFAAIAFILYYLSRLPKGGEHIALSLILGGAIGNLTDRLRVGQVIDFIDFFIGEWHWPAFNVADSALTIGIIIFIWSNFRQARHMQNNS